jgi:hypothetical protein
LCVASGFSFVFVSFRFHFFDRKIRLHGSKSAGLKPKRKSLALFGHPERLHCGVFVAGDQPDLSSDCSADARTPDGPQHPGRGTGALKTV